MFDPSLTLKAAIMCCNNRDEFTNDEWWCGREATFSDGIPDGTAAISEERMTAFHAEARKWFEDEGWTFDDGTLCPECSKARTAQAE